MTLLKATKYKLPSLSIVIPTYNSENVLDLCLKAISIQKYPKNLIEIIIADGGSSDNTLRIAKKYEAIIIKNPLRSGEAGKSVGVKKATNEIVALIDSDNILESNDWLNQMISPFKDPTIISSEPLYWTYRKKDTLINRYCSLTGINDPLCLFLGNYDRYSFLTDKWTGYDIEQEDFKSFIKVFLDSSSIPTMGANGFLIRRNIINKICYEPYLFDIDVLQTLVNNGYNTIARPKIGIIHLFCDSLSSFIKKTWRRARDYAMFKNMRNYNWPLTRNVGIHKFILYTITLFPLLYQANKGYKNKPDRAWYIHPLLSWITFLIYFIWFFILIAQNNE